MCDDDPSLASPAGGTATTSLVAGGPSSPAGTTTAVLTPQQQAEQALAARKVVAVDGRRPEPATVRLPPEPAAPPPPPTPLERIPKELPEWVRPAGRAALAVLGVAVLLVAGFFVKGIVFPPPQPGDDLPEAARNGLRSACPVWAEAPLSGSGLVAAADRIRPDLEAASTVPQFAHLAADIGLVASFAPRAGSPDVPLTEVAAFSQAVDRIDAACDLVGI